MDYSGYDTVANVFDRMLDDKENPYYRLMPLNIPTQKQSSTV